MRSTESVLELEPELTFLAINAGAFHEKVISLYRESEEKRNDKISKSEDHHPHSKNFILIFVSMMFF